MHKHIAIISVGILMALLPFRSMQAQTVLLADNRSLNEPTKRNEFSCNPLVLNGSPLNYTFFSIFSRGKLALVSGDPASKDATKIPFRVYLRRSGMIIQKGAYDSGREHYDVDIATVLALAQHGDELVIDPVWQDDWVTRRILRVKGMTWLFPLPGC